MRRRPSERPFRRVRKTRRLEPADLEDDMEEAPLEDWMTGGPGGK